MVRNLPFNVEDTGSIPGWGAKIPCAVGQLGLMLQLESPCTTSREPTCSRVCAPQENPVCPQATLKAHEPQQKYPGKQSNKQKTDSLPALLSFKHTMLPLTFTSRHLYLNSIEFFKTYLQFHSVSFWETSSFHPAF